MNEVNLLKLPELLQAIAVFVGNSGNLSSFAQVDQFIHAAVTPRLFRSIDLDLDVVDSLALAFRNDPNRAASCRSLSFRPGRYEGGLLDDSTGQKLHKNLITIFGAISAHGLLSRLRWRSRIYRGRGMALSAEVWAAISLASSSLQELDMYIPSTEKQFWKSLTHTRFTQLRVLRLCLTDAHGWNCDHLQSMLSTLGDLEELSLEFPECCGPRGITLESTHPYLKRFSLTGCALFEAKSDFLTRHPALESLCLATEQTFWSGTASSESPLKMLRALNIDEYSLYHSPTLMDSHITHLRLRLRLHLRGSGHGDDPAVGAVCAVGRTLRCLELDIRGMFNDSLNPLPPHAIALLRRLNFAPALDELGIIIRHGLSPLPHNWSSNMLTAVVTTIGPATPLRALRFRCGQTLPEKRLHDLGPLPPRLKYMGWDIASGKSYTSLIYAIEQRQRQKMVVNTLARSETDDWMAEGVLHFMGESRT
ncbi:hypothetical protein K438DRAFT_1845746 [Mycena galopus ATCC 62051]|nr:hypothetical protein K438DRAFT_1845746 [Mycena galopus ATCC 62051]